MKNQHQRIIPCEASTIFSLLESMGTSGDKIWPDSSIPFKRTEGTMQVGITKERHGIIKATLSEYTQNKSIVWDAQLPFLQGIHGFYLQASPNGDTQITHKLIAKLRWWFIPIWYCYVRAIHNRIIEDIFDNIEKQLRH